MLPDRCVWPRTASFIWKPGKDVQHLNRRIEYGHLPPQTNLQSYEAIISDVLHQSSAYVYAYVWRQSIYPTVSAPYKNRVWLIMVNLDGIMETAFPPTDAAAYSADSRFHYLGTVEEVLT